MKEIKYWCPTCKKELVFKTSDPVIPAQSSCVKCRGQVWLREVKDVEKKG
jgi:DNA-directed RNA polymerase subunit RPC12/RpoP